MTILGMNPFLLVLVALWVWFVLWFIEVLPIIIGAFYIVIRDELKSLKATLKRFYSNRVAGE